MLRSLLRTMISPRKTSAHGIHHPPHSVWVSIRHRATRDVAINHQRVALSRHVVRFDAGGVMHIEQSTHWRPFHPREEDFRQTTLSLFDGGRLLAKTEVFGNQWDRIDAKGVEGFLLEAVVTRNFASALARSSMA